MVYYTEKNGVETLASNTLNKTWHFEVFSAQSAETIRYLFIYKIAMYTCIGYVCIQIYLI